MTTKPEAIPAVKKFRKKPVVIDAVQINTREQADNIPGICTGGSGCQGRGPDGAWPHVHTLEGDHSWSPGDWLITGVRGERYFCKPDIFKATYEPVVHIMADRASRAPVDGTEAKPVAWQLLCGDGTWSDDISREEGVQDEWKSWGFESRPLYTHPAPASPDAELVRALRLAEHDQIDLLYHCRRHAESASNDPDKYSMRMVRADRVEDRLKGTREVLSKHGGPRS